MKLLLVAVPALLLPLAGVPEADSTPSVAPGAHAYEVDPSHSTMVFRVQHAGAAFFWGRFNEIDGEMTLDPDAPDKGSIDLRINAASVDTASDRRDRHLRGPDFFDATQFKWLTFVSEKIRKTGDGVYEAEGELGMRGVKKPLKATFRHTGTGEFRGSTRDGFESTFTVKRSDFGVNFGVEQKVLGDDVRVTISLEMIRG